MHKNRNIIFLSLFCAVHVAFSQTGKIVFWNEQRKGANWFNDAPTEEWLIAAKEAGITLVRLAPNKWKTAQRDFLIGNADHYEKMVEPDFAKLQETLNQAEAAGVKIVLTMLSLPGARWRQQNGDQPDLRLWQEPRYLQQVMRFWQDLASRFKDHPAIVGYNILNEPTPELVAGLRNPHSQNFVDWHNKAKGTAADLDQFYAQVVATIRAVDRETPIILDGGFWASADAFPFLIPLSDEKTLYSFHMYEPFAYTNRRVNNGRFGYPGKLILPTNTGKDVEVNLDHGELENILQPVVAWQHQHHIPAHRILAGEFGCNRTVKGAANYFGDLIALFNHHEWHWAFYPFREDSWDGMDYELGAKPPGATYWEAKERGENPTLPRVQNPIWDVIQKEFGTRNR